MCSKAADGELRAGVSLIEKLLLFTNLFLLHLLQAFRLSTQFPQFLRIVLEFFIILSFEHFNNVQRLSRGIFGRARKISHKMLAEC